MENVLIKPTIIIFLLGYLTGILTVGVYFYMLQKPEYSKQIHNVQQLFKKTIFGYPSSASEESPIRARPRTPSDAQKLAIVQRTKDTKSENMMNKDIVNYFEVFLEILMSVKSMKDLRSKIESASDKIIAIKKKYFTKKLE